MSNEKRNTTSNTEMVTISRAEYEKLQSQQSYVSELEQQNQWLMEQLRLAQRRTIDWQKRDSARAKMRMLIKKLLKKHKYPPEGMDDALQTVMLQCELWTDNVMDVESEQKPHKTVTYDFSQPRDIGMVAEDPAPYGKKE